MSVPHEHDAVHAAGTREVASALHDDYSGRVAEFVRGYQDADGPFDKLTHVLDDVIPCESGWNNIYGYDGPNGYLSVAQFDPDSWRKAGGGDPFDLYQTGGNVARWIRMIDDPGSTSGWPTCWHRGGW